MSAREDPTSKRRYSVICVSIVGNMQDGFSSVYSIDDKRFSERQDAIDHGFTFGRSDDFNIGVWKGKKLVSVDWMERPVDTDPALLRQIQTIGEVR